MLSNIHNFRWDIQGLRAIAVLCVVIFHINPTVLPGGYLGVDIFFVISGYLILGFIWRDLKQNKFTIVRFYSKRIYRLAPALFATVLTTSVAAYFILLPNEGMTYVESLFSTLFYYSNFYFYTQSDYFNSTMEFYPLLHTWSLSVEEQFYIVFPFILLFIYKKKKEYIIPILLILAIISLLLSQVSIQYDQNDFAFFASPTRFFQFIIGGLISIGVQKNSLNKQVNDFLGVSGLVILGVSAYLYTSYTPFPGLNALFPSFGTALVLYSGLNARYTTHFLSNTLFRWIGNASYSIYLWHWPLIVFYKLKFSPTLSVTEQIILFFSALILGFLSWWFIEEKMRRGYLRQFNVFYVNISMSVLMGMAIYTFFSLPQFSNKNYKEKVMTYMDYDASSEFRAGTCFLTSAQHSMDAYSRETCVVWQKEKKNYLLIGDSHAAHYYRALESLLASNETLTQVTASGCLPIFSLTWGTQVCRDLHTWALNNLIKEKHFDVIILSMANLERTTNEAIKRTIEHMLKYTDRVVFLGRTMRYKQSLPRLLMNLSEGENTSMIHQKAGDYDYTLTLDTTMKKFFQMDRVTYISTLQLMCTKEKVCRTLTPGGVPMYFDKDHFTKEGSLYILKQMKNDIFERK